MATYTPNIDLKKPAQSDKIRIADLNGNADNIDAALGADFGVSNKPSVDDAVNSLGAGLAIISNGDIHAAITAGQYVYVRGHGTLTEGLYVATANVSQNGALTGNNVDAVSNGGLNALNSKITTLSGSVLSTQNQSTLELALHNTLYDINSQRNFGNMAIGTHLDFVMTWTSHDFYVGTVTKVDGSYIKGTLTNGVNFYAWSHNITTDTLTLTTIA